MWQRRKVIVDVKGSMSEAGESGRVQREHASEPSEERGGGEKGIVGDQEARRVKSQVTKMIGSYREGLLGEGQPRPWGGEL